MELTCTPWDGEFELESIQHPTLVIRGSSDVCVTRNMALHLAQRIPGARHPAAVDAATGLRTALEGLKRDGAIESAAQSARRGVVKAVGTVGVAAAAPAGAVGAARAGVPVTATAGAAAGAAALVEVEGEGHFSLVERCMGAILTAAASMAAS